MTPRPSLLTTQATAATLWLAKIRLSCKEAGETLRNALLTIRILIDQHQRSEELMSQIAQVIQFERQRAETAEAKVTDLTARLEVAVKNAPDAEDLAEVAKGLAEISVPEGTPPTPA